MKIISILCFYIIIQAVYSANKFQLINRCSQTIYASIVGDKGRVDNKRMNSGEQIVYLMPEGWSGRVWGRKDSDQQLNVNTLAEFTLGKTAGAMDFYDVSLVDGFNIPVKVTPIPGTYRNTNDKYYCGSAGCEHDMNSHCPQDLQIKDKANRVVQCMSACTKYRSDQYCCTGYYSKADTCKPTWYSQQFKQVCPDAYSYAYDDHTSTFTCPKYSYVDYYITFCP